MADHMGYHLEGRVEEDLAEIVFSVVATRRSQHRGAPKLAEVAVLKVKGGAILEKLCESLPTLPGRFGGKEKRSAVSKLHRFLRGTVIASFDLTKDLRLLEWISTSHGFDRLGNERLSLRKLSSYLLPDLPGHDLERVAPYFGVRLLPEEGALARAEASADILVELLGLARGKGIESLSRLRESMEESREQIAWERYAFDRNLIEYMPPSPGVYLMKDRQGQVIYVGKALSLRERVLSYFTGKEEERIRGLRERVFDIDYEETGTVLMALLREAELIAALLPEFNTVLARGARARAKKHVGMAGPAESGKSPRSGQKRPSGRRRRSSRAAGKLLFLPSASRDTIDLILTVKAKPLWKGSLLTDLSNLPPILHELAAFLSGPPETTLDRSEELEVSLVEGWLSRNEDSVNLIELGGNEDEGALESAIRPLVESGDWRGEKVVYRM